MPWGSALHLALDLVVRDVGPGVEALALHGVQVGLLGGVHGVEDVGIEQGAVEADLAVQEVELAGGLLHGVEIQARGTGRNVAVHEAAERLHQGEALVAVEIDLVVLGGGQRLQLGELAVVQDVDDVVGDPGQEAGVVAHVVGVVVAQVLEAGVVGHLARREEGLGVQVPGHHGEAVKGQGRALGLVGKGLGQVVGGS